MALISGFRGLIGALALTAALPIVSVPANAQSDKPNILVIWGDDIGQSNISAYTFGLVGYRTPNIDRIAREGMMFTDYYGEQSCTAGRSSYITGQSVFRTGLSKVGLPGAEQGMREEDPTIAGLLKAEGYMTGQFGKNHLGDKDEHLPTNHGFDEFFGNLYHLNAEEEPENEDYPGDMKMPDGRTFREPSARAASSSPRPTACHRGHRPLTKKRMETVDDETVLGCHRFHQARPRGRASPSIVWWNGTRMHFRTHVKDDICARRPTRSSARMSTNTPTGMIEHDMHVGQLLDRDRRTRHRRQHHRALLDRQRSALQHMARRRS